METLPNAPAPDAIDWLLGLDDDEDFVQFLLHLVRHPSHGLAAVFYEPVTKRCAIIERDNQMVTYGLLRSGLRAIKGFALDEYLRAIAPYLAGNSLDIVPLSSIEPEEITWLWEPYIPLKKLTLVEGDPSAGKTYLLLAIAAAVTQGYALPDAVGFVGMPTRENSSNVLYLTAEDGVADTIRPRADKAGADLDRLFVLSQQATISAPFSLAQPQLLDAAMTQHNVRLVILDPLTAFLGADMDMHRANEVRPFMSILANLGAKHNAAMVAVRHWTKAVGGRARHRGQGNADFYAAARSVLSVGESPESDQLRVMAQSKMSLQSLGKSIVFEISDEGLRWAGTSELTADDLSQMQPTKRQHQRKEATEWLKEYLRGGPAKSTEVYTAAEAVGLASRTLERAKEALKILSSKDKYSGAWYWRLPQFEAWDRYAGQEDDDAPVPF